MRIIPESRAGPGVLKVYATWCPHCISKVEDLNRLAKLLKPQGMAIYVLEGEQNPIFLSKYKVQGFPTFFETLEDGSIGKQLQVGGVPDIVRERCGNNKSVCAFISQMES